MKHIKKDLIPIWQLVSVLRVPLCILLWIVNLVTEQRFVYSTTLLPPPPPPPPRYGSQGYDNKKNNIALVHEN